MTHSVAPVTAAVPDVVGIQRQLIAAQAEALYALGNAAHTAQQRNRPMDPAWVLKVVEEARNTLNRTMVGIQLAEKEAKERAAVPAKEPEEESV